MMRTFAFMKLAGKDPAAILMGLGHGYIEAALAIARYTTRIQDSRHGGVLTYVPVISNLHQGLEDFLKGASLSTGLKLASTHDLEEHVRRYNEHVIRADNVPDGASFDHGCVRSVAKWDKWASRTCKPGVAMRYLSDKKLEPAYPGLTISEEELQATATACRDECVRVHIVLIQAFVPGKDVDIVHPLRPWWEPAQSFEKRLRVRLTELGLPSDQIMGVTEGHSEQEQPVEPG